MRVKLFDSSSDIMKDVSAQLGGLIVIESPSNVIADDIVISKQTTAYSEHYNDNIGIYMRKHYPEWGCAEI